MVWCAGALARDYALLGGRTLIAGKPFRPIYDLALAAASDVLDRDTSRTRMRSPSATACRPTSRARPTTGFDVLYISGGIHARDYGDTAHAPDAARLAAFLAHHGQKPVAIMPRLR